MEQEGEDPSDTPEQMKQKLKLEPSCCIENDNEKEKEILIDSKAYETHEESLIRRGLYILRKTESNGPFTQAVQELERIYRDYTTDAELVEDRWTRIFGGAVNLRINVHELQRARVSYQESSNNTHQIRSWSQHVKRFEQMQQEDKRDKLCAVCHKPAENRCLQCLRTFYCSLEHQEYDWKRHKKHGCNMPDVFPFFNELSIMRGKTACKKFNETEEAWQDLSEEDYSMVAFPGPKITLSPFPPLSNLRGEMPTTHLERTYKAPGNKSYFSVRDLLQALADLELHIMLTCIESTGGLGSEEVFGDRIFFAEFCRLLRDNGKVKFGPLYSRDPKLTS